MVQKKYNRIEKKFEINLKEFRQDSIDIKLRPFSASSSRKECNVPVSIGKMSPDIYREYFLILE